VYPAGNLAMAGGMLNSVAMTIARRSTLRPLRRLSDSPAVSPIERKPSNRCFPADRLDIAGVYPSGQWAAASPSPLAWGPCPPPGRETGTGGAGASLAQHEVRHRHGHRRGRSLVDCDCERSRCRDREFDVEPTALLHRGEDHA